jgi:hypothetical protein
VFVACSNTFFQLSANSTQVWMFSRYALIMEYEAKPLLPTPLSILCHVYDIVKRLARKCRKEEHNYTGLSTSLTTANTATVLLLLVM